MSPPGPKPLDVDRMADGQADIDFMVSLADLPRLRSRLQSIGGTVSGHVHFSRDSGFAVAELKMSGTATLQCQRCMESMVVPVDTGTRVALLSSEADAGRAPDDLEPVLAPGGQISVADLVEEELMLYLPIVPRHEGESECGIVQSVPQVADEGPATTQKPFAQLGDLLKR